MASEITVGVTLEANKSGTKVVRSVTGKKENQTGSGGGGPGEVTINTSETTVDLTGYGRVVIENLDAANYVRWGFATGVYKARLQAGGAPTTMFLEAATTLYFIANTAACQIRITGVTL